MPGTTIWKDIILAEYLDNFIDKKCKMVAAFYLKDVGYPHPKLGITSNLGESFNQMLKHQAGSKEHTDGEQMLLLYY